MIFGKPKMNSAENEFSRKNDTYQIDVKNVFFRRSCVAVTSFSQNVCFTYKTINLFPLFFSRWLVVIVGLSLNFFSYDFELSHG